MPKDRTRSKPAALPIIHHFAAGIDIGSRFHVVAVSPDLCDEPIETFQCAEPGVTRSPGSGLHFPFKGARGQVSTFACRGRGKGIKEARLALKLVSHIPPSADPSKKARYISRAIPD